MSATGTKDDPWVLKTPPGTSDYTIGVPNQLLQYPIPARTTADASLGFSPGASNWSVHAVVKNVSDKVAPIAIDSFGMLVPSDPRTVDVRLDYRF